MNTYLCDEREIHHNRSFPHNPMLTVFFPLSTNHDILQPALNSTYNLQGVQSRQRSVAWLALRQSTGTV